jgi:hypothetical protein
VPEEDDAAYRRRIAEALVQNGFEWVVEQADSQIAEGKASTKQVSEQQSFHPAADPMFEIRKPRRRRASLITSEPYSEAEKLEILLHGVKAAIAERAQLERAVLDQLSGITEIEFQPDAPVEEADFGYRGRVHRLNRSMIEEGQILESRTEHAFREMMGREIGGQRATDL